MHMWKKEEVPAPTPTPQPESVPRPERHAPTPAVAERATIGRSITIRGEVTGDEDLLIQGRVEGSVDLKQHSVTVGSDGEVKASIIGRIVVVEGRVEGDISAEEQVILRSSASVQGDIIAARVVLEDGARFRGGVDMGDVGDRGKRSSSTAAANQPRRGNDSPRSTPDLLENAGDKGKAGASSGVQVTT